MRLYEGSIEAFIQDTIQNQIATKIKDRYEEYYGKKVNYSEMTSWINSLQFLKNVLEYNSPRDNMVILEYELPYSNGRIDCILFGKDKDAKDTVVVVELKQWRIVQDSEIENNVVVVLGRKPREIPHPSYQVKGYHYYLKDFIEMLHDESSTNLSSCVYCHNYDTSSTNPLFKPKFKDILREFPVFTRNDFKNLGGFLKKRLIGGKGLEIFNRFITSKIKPSKKLVDVTKKMIDGQHIFTLIDDQIAANNTIIDRAKNCSKLKKKSVIIVQGGPGTGKSVIALNALAELLTRRLMVYHATGSAAFTRTLRRIVGPRAGKLFKYFNSFITHKENEIDILICDEAHRIRKHSASRFTPKAMRTGMPQVDELVKSAKTSIFFIDDYQVVRPEEIGSSSLIKETALKYGAEIYEFELKSQFRCSGSDGYLNWLDNLLGIRETANPFLTKHEKMEFKIFNSPQELYGAIKKKNVEQENSARLVAGFCWSWSDPNPDGTLKEDVVIGDFKMPWEGKDGKKLAKGIPPAPLWAYEPKGINQIGSIYTIQGFEFEYVGVIFGKDLVYNPVSKSWEGIKKNSADSFLKRADENKFIDYVKNIYRVLLTRGMKGCYVYFMDKDTEEYFKSKIII